MVVKRPTRDDQTTPSGSRPPRCGYHGTGTSSGNDRGNTPDSRNDKRGVSGSSTSCWKTSNVYDLSQSRCRRFVGKNVATGQRECHLVAELDIDDVLRQHCTQLWKCGRHLADFEVA
ncbi:hypothetical protein LSAT2_008719 [Lamellibrachia satsuma]|nr:hypothetical protein LSAT2_008719 [Lamellibrachia satsuma]